MTTAQSGTGANAANGCPEAPRNAGVSVPEPVCTDAMLFAACRAYGISPHGDHYSKRVMRLAILAALREQRVFR